MDWLSALSDDQIALFGCVIALASAFAVMSLTWTVRQTLQPSKQAVSAFQPRVAPQPQTAQRDSHRKAA